VPEGLTETEALRDAAVIGRISPEGKRRVVEALHNQGRYVAMVAEGRRILRNLQRVTKLFVTKSVFAAFLIVAIGITPTEYPLLPRHLTIVGALTVGIPAFFLALAPSDGPWRTNGFLREVTRFAVPAGVAAGVGVCTRALRRPRRWSSSASISCSRSRRPARIGPASSASCVLRSSQHTWRFCSCRVCATSTSSLSRPSRPCR